jgi:hypothetical protein
MAEEINTGNDVGGGDDAAIGSYQWELPTIEFEDLWQSLVYDNKCPKEEVSYLLRLIKINSSRKIDAQIHKNDNENGECQCESGNYYPKSTYSIERFLSRMFKLI